MAFTKQDVAEIYDDLRKFVRYVRLANNGSLTGTDLANTALVKLFTILEKNPERFTSKDHFLAFFFLAVKHARISHHRGTERHNPIDALRDLAPIVRGEYAVGPDEGTALEFMLDALRRDPHLENAERIARVVELHVIGGLPFKETAAELGGTDATVKMDMEYFRTWLFSRTANDRLEIERASETLEREGDPESKRLAHAARLALVECRPWNLVARALRVSAAEAKELVTQFKARMFPDGPVEGQNERPKWTPSSSGSSLAKPVSGREKS